MKHSSKLQWLSFRLTYHLFQKLLVIQTASLSISPISSFNSTTAEKKKNPQLSVPVLQLLGISWSIDTQAWMLDHFTQKHCIYWSFRCRASIDSPAPFSQHTHTAATGKHVCEGKIARAPCSARQSPASGPALWRVKIPKQLGLLCVSVCVCVCVCEWRE